MYDFHTHFIPGDVFTWLKDNRNTVNAKLEKQSQAQGEILSINGKWPFELTNLFIDEEIYLAAQKKAGVSHAVVSPIPQLFLYEFPSDITSELAAVYNQALAEMCQKNSQLSALATVPLNDPEKAAQELSDAMKLGLKGAIIGPGCNRYMLTNNELSPFWEEADRQKAIIFIHPLLCEDQRLKQRKMPSLIGVPWETTICATDILLSGMLDRYSKVKILLAHGGGFLPYQIGRLDKGYEKWTIVSGQLTKKPSEYLQEFWYDNVLWDSRCINYLTNIVGRERIVPGSDFPFDLCSWPPAGDFTESSQALLAQ